MESFVKEINWRVKKTEKFWNNPGGANPILALKAASLYDGDRIDKFLFNHNIPCPALPTRFPQVS